MKRYQLTLLALILAGAATVTSCENDNNPYQDELINEYTGDSYGDLKSPYIQYDPKMDYGHLTTWTCVNFGSYPQAEVLKGSTDAVESYALDEGDIIIDATLFARLESATWTDNETTLDGNRYRRLTSSDAVTWSTDSRGHYRWKSEAEVHYFLYQPVRWRILNINGNTATLMADKALECARFNDTYDAVVWENCTLRQWMNSEVYDSIFNDEEKKSVLLGNVSNNENYYFGTYCGDDTKDYLYILSEEETFCGKPAVKYGFLDTDGLDDPARRFRPTMYAKCRGVWISPVESYLGNTFWFMRSTGYTPFNVTYVCEFGYLYNRGTLITCDDSGIVPVVKVDLSSANLRATGTVTSDDIIQ